MRPRETSVTWLYYKAPWDFVNLTIVHDGKENARPTAGLHPIYCEASFSLEPIALYHYGDTLLILDLTQKNWCWEKNDNLTRWMTPWLTNTTTNINTNINTHISIIINNYTTNTMVDTGEHNGW